MLNSVATVVTAALVLILFIISVTNLHLLFLQSIVAQQLDQELPAPNETKQVPSEGNQTERCISPCPPGQICIQMCKHIGQPERLTATPELSPPTTAMNTGEEQENPLALTPSSDQTTQEQERQSPVPDDEDLSSEDEGKDAMTQQEPTD